MVAANSIAETRISLSGARRGGFAFKLSRVLSGVVFYSVLALILLVAAPYGTVQPWWEALFQCLIFALSVLWVSAGLLGGVWLRRQHRIFLPLLFLALYAFIQSLSLQSMTVAGLKVSNAISADPFETRLSVLQLLALILAGAMLLSQTTSRGRLRALVYTLIGTGLLSALFGLLRQTTQHSAGFLLPSLMPGSGYGQFINKNHFAYLMEMTLGLTLGLIVARGVRREHRLIYLALALPLWTALVLCNSRGGILSMLAQVFFLAILLSRSGREAVEQREQGDVNLLSRLTRTTVFRSLLIIILVATVFLGALWIGGEALTSRLETVPNEIKTSENQTGVGRKEIWLATWKMILDHPLVGVGFNGYWAAIPHYHQASGELTPRQAHNDYLELVASGGIIAVAFVLWFLLLLLKEMKRSSQRLEAFHQAARIGALTGMFGVAVHSVVDFGLHLTVNALVLTALIVIALAQIRTEDEDTPVVSKRRFATTQSIKRNETYLPSRVEKIDLR